MPEITATMHHPIITCHASLFSLDSPDKLSTQKFFRLARHTAVALKVLWYMDERGPWMCRKPVHRNRGCRGDVVKKPRKTGEEKVVAIEDGDDCLAMKV